MRPVECFVSLKLSIRFSGALCELEHKVVCDQWGAL